MGIVKKPDNCSEVQGGNINADAYVMPHGDTKLAILRKADIADDEYFVLVDLSDSTQFPHTETGKIRLYSITLTSEKATDGQFIFYFGVIIEVDGTDGSTKHILVVDLESVLNPTDSTDRFVYQFKWDGGIDLEVSAGAMVNVVSNGGETDDVEWNTGSALDSPVGDTSNAPGAGDLVLFVDETGGSGTVSFTVTVEYTTEEA